MEGDHGKLQAGCGSGSLMEIEREELLDQIARDLGIVERDVGEFTAFELADKFQIDRNNLVYFLMTNEIGFTRRKAIANGRRQFVYKIINE